MLREVINVRQVPGDLRRRWFESTHCDLIVWYTAEGTLAGFQFCYDKGHAERALTWKSPQAFSHMAVDTGEVHPLQYKAIPILVPDGHFDAERVERLFLREGETLPADVVALVCEKIAECAENLS